MYEKDALALANEVAAETGDYWKDFRYSERHGGKAIIIAGHDIIADNLYDGKHARLMAMHDPATVRALCKAVALMRVIADWDIDALPREDRYLCDMARVTIAEIDAVTK